MSDDLLRRVEEILKVPSGYLSEENSVARTWLWSRPSPQSLTLTTESLASAFIVSGSIFPISSVTGPTPTTGQVVDSVLCFPEYQLGRWRLGTGFRTAPLNDSDMFGFVGLEEQTGARHSPEEIGLAVVEEQDGFASHFSRWLFDRKTMISMIFSKLNGGFHLTCMHFGLYGMREEIAVVATDDGRCGDVFSNRAVCDFCLLRGVQCDCASALSSRRLDRMFAAPDVRDDDLESVTSWTFPVLHTLVTATKTPHFYHRQRMDCFLHRDSAPGGRELLSVGSFFCWANDDRFELFRLHRTHLCRHVNKQLSMNQELVLHDAQAVSPKKAKPTCKYCGKTFASTSNLSRHEASAHTHAAATYWCRLCDPPFSFSQKTNYLRHVREVHEGERNFVCQACGARFSRKYDHKRHTSTCAYSKRAVMAG